jgi:uncharacterized protein YkwD
MKKIVLSFLIIATALILAVPGRAEDSSGKNALITMVNAEREAIDAPSISPIEALEAAAEVRAQEASTVFSHKRPDGSRWYTAIGDQGIVYRFAGECLACGYDTPQAVFDAWMESPAHKRVLLHPDFQYIGVGYCIRNGVTYWALEFIARADP